MTSDETDPNAAPQPPADPQPPAAQPPEAAPTPEAPPTAAAPTPPPPPPSGPPIEAAPSPAGPAPAAAPTAPAPPAPPAPTAALSGPQVPPVPAAPASAVPPVPPVPPAAPQAWVAPAAAPPAGGPRRGLPLGAILGIAGGAVAFVLVVVLVLVFVVVPNVTRNSSPTGSPDGTVAAYLKAVAAGKAKTALSYLDKTPSGDLLTDEVLEQSEKLGAIRGIKVLKPTRVNKYGTDVTARYTIGGKPVAARFSASQDDDGSWKLLEGTADVDLGHRFAGLALTVNGRPVTGDSVTLFPGTYRLATTAKYFTLGGDTTFTVTKPFDFPDLSDVKPTLTDDGVAAFRKAVTDAVNACVASKALAAGCGLDLQATSSNGYTIIDGTITRTLSADAQTNLANLEPETDILGPTKVSAAGGIGSVDVDAQCTSGPCRLILGKQVGSPLVDFSTDPPTVRWDQ